MRPRAEQANMVLLRKELRARPMTAYHAAELLRIDIRNARPYMRLLHTGKEVHICRWEMHGPGRKVPVYALGEDRDAPMPVNTRALTRKIKGVMRDPFMYLLRRT